MFEVTNIVVRSALNVSLNLRELAHKLRDVRYNPKKFSAIIWHHKRVGGSCLLFNNGQIIVQGSKTLKEAKLRVRRFARLIQKQGYSVTLGQISLVTASAVATLGHSLDLHNVASLMTGSFEPELFNGAVFYKDNIHYSCFTSGKIVITGIKSFASIDSHIYPVLMELSL